MKDDICNVTLPRLPQVQVYNLMEYEHGPDDVMVMGTDGLWDVTTDKEVADAVTNFLSGCDPIDPMRLVCTLPVSHGFGGLLHILEEFLFFS